MRTIPVDTDPDPASTHTEPPRFWRRIAQALDQYFVDRTRRMVPEATLRRSKHEVARCRRLMLKSSAAPVAAAVGRASRHRGAQIRPR